MDGKRVLVADDDAFVRVLARDTLESAGFTVEYAADGEEALAVFDRFLPDLVLLDVHMPLMDGYAVCREIRRAAKGSGTVVLMMTARDDSDSIRTAYEAGATDFMVKPINWFVLGHRAKYMIRAKQAQDELRANQRQLDAHNKSLEVQIADKVAELRNRDRILIQQDRFASLGEIASNIAHQWRQPLNGLGLLIQSLSITHEHGELSSEVLNDKVRRGMDMIRSMSQTIDEFRFFFKPENSVLKEVLFSNTINQVVALLGPGLQSLGIECEYRCEEDSSVLLTQSELTQVLINIMKNAKEVLVERKVLQPKILIRSFREEGVAVISIRDNGGGIDETVLPRVFDPYFTTKHKAPGAGIGLYMSKIIVERYLGGTLSAATENGCTEFRLAFQHSSP